MGSLGSQTQVGTDSLLPSLPAGLPSKALARGPLGSVFSVTRFPLKSENSGLGAEGAICWVWLLRHRNPSEGLVCGRLG